MPSRRPAPSRSLLALPLLALLVAGGLAGCGRRGPLQPPSPDPSVPPAAAVEAPAPTPAGRAAPRDRRLRQGAAAPAAPTTLATQPGAVVADAPDDEDDETDTARSVSPSPTPTARKRTRAYSVPNEPFLLDPLL